MYDTPTDWLDHSARNHPRRAALAEGGRQVDYAGLRARAGALAAVLADQGAGPGDPVAIDLPPGIDHAVALHGAILLGAVVQPLPAGGREGVLVAPGAAFADAGTIERASASDSGFETVRRPPGDPVARILSSGTTGEPKPIELTGGNFLWSAIASAFNLGVEPGDRWLCCLPLNHVGGLSILIRSAIYGTAAVIHDRFDADRVAAAFAAGEATLVSLVPTQLVRLIEADAPIDRPRLLLLGGGPVSADVLEEALGRGATVVQTYGMTETCSQVCTLAPGEARSRVGSAGRALPGIEVRVASGEIQVRGPVVAPGSVAADGWLHTGDLGRLDPEGYLWVEGRREDLIVTGGENVRPERVEAALAEHSEVAEVAVAGIEDREWGQAVTAFVVPASGEPPAADELIGFARDRLAAHEVPKRVVIVADLPRTASGKLQRRLLAERL